MSYGTLVIVRHGQSAWNLENRFTGWVDVDITDAGKAEAVAAGQSLQSSGLEFDEVHTSVLRRAIHTSWAILGELEMSWLPTFRSWRLNERHYGGLQGLNKAETAAEHGDDQVHIWRRSYDVPPPAAPADDPTVRDRRYAGVPAGDLPQSESLALTVARTKPYLDAEILPKLQSGKNLLVVAHGNSLRGIVMSLDGITSDKIPGVNIPTGLPLVYSFDDRGDVAHRVYLGESSRTQSAQSELDGARPG